MSGITGELTEQRIFDHVATHLLKQGHAAMGEDSRGIGQVCRYLTEEGDKCAIGCLFTEEEYSKSMEGMSVAVLAEVHKLPGRLKPYIPLLIWLQEEHDAVLADHGVIAWVEGMVRIAQDKGLSVDVLNCKGELS